MNSIRIGDKAAYNRLSARTRLWTQGLPNALISSLLADGAELLLKVLMGAAFAGLIFTADQPVIPALSAAAAGSACPTWQVSAAPTEHETI